MVHASGSQRPQISTVTLELSRFDQIRSYVQHRNDGKRRNARTRTSHSSTHAWWASAVSWTKLCRLFLRRRERRPGRDPMRLRGLHSRLQSILRRVISGRRMKMTGCGQYAICGASLDVTGTFDNKTSTTSKVRLWYRYNWGISMMWYRDRVWRHVSWGPSDKTHVLW